MKVVILAVEWFVETLGNKVYRMTWFLLAPVLFPFIKIIGKKNLKRHSCSGGGLIIVANHIAYLDIPIIGLLFSPNANIHFFGKKELLDIPILKTVFKHGNMISVDREHPVSAINIRAFKRAISVLKLGGIICIFMQGGIGRADTKDSPIRLAQKTGAMILPIHLAQKTMIHFDAYGNVDIGPYTAIIGEKTFWRDLGNESSDVLAEKLWKKIIELK